MLIKPSTFLMVSVWHCRHDATITNGTWGCSIERDSTNLFSFIPSVFEVLKRRNMGNTFLKIKAFWWNSPFEEVQRWLGVQSCVVKDTLTSLLHYSETSEGEDTPEDLMISNSDILIYFGQILLIELIIWEIRFLANSFDKDWYHSYVCLSNMKLTLPAVAA